MAEGGCSVRLYMNRFDVVAMLEDGLDRRSRQISPHAAQVLAGRPAQRLTLYRLRFRFQTYGVREDSRVGWYFTALMSKKVLGLRRSFRTGIRGS